MAVARRNGLSFEDLDASSRVVATDKIMLKIASICGCSLPNTNFFAQSISEEIEQFLLTMGFGNLTIEEIILAFRINSMREQPVIFSGVCVNVDFMAKVLKYYMEKRQIFDGILKNKIDGYEL